MSESMPESVNAIVLAVGTELTSGQVINSNAAWLASQLTEAGVETMLHWTVPDDRPLIREALAAAAQKTRLVLITGGLGPTTDDFTREVVADWLGQPLAFDQASWERLEEKARNYGFTLGSSQKQQCYFPQGAEVFANPAGTADAFGCFSADFNLVVLPGPPMEIKALWAAGVFARLQPLLPERAPVKLYRWQCLGIGEGNLGELVEAALADESGIVTGYRAHAPYIEFKLWVPADRDPAPLLEKVESVLSLWIVLRDDEDAAVRLLAALAQPVRIIDGATGGMLAARLREGLKQAPRTHELILETRWQPQPDPQQAMAWLAEAQAPETLQLAIGGLRDGQWSLGLRQGEQLKFELCKLPWAGPRERSLRYVCEKALMTFREWLHEEQS
ncbi:MAG: competence/damage-inducible protein A [Candidatus Sericytochromatia bacterium]